MSTALHAVSARPDRYPVDVTLPSASGRALVLTGVPSLPIQTDPAGPACPLPPSTSGAFLHMQQMPSPLPVCPQLAAAAADVLSSSSSAAAAIETSGQLLAQVADIEHVTVALTLRRPEDHEKWTAFGGRAWLRHFTRASATPVWPATAAHRPLSLPYVSQAGRATGVAALPDTEALARLGLLARTDLCELRACGIGSMLSVLLAHDGIVFGSIALNRPTAGLWDPALAGGLRLLASAIATRLVTERSHELVADAVAVAEEARSTQQQFFRTLGHELRTPIAAIMGTAEMLHADLTDLPDPIPVPVTDPVAERVAGPVEALTRQSMLADTAVILSAAEQLNDVIAELLSAAQLGAADRVHEPVVLLDATRDVTHWLHAPALARRVTVSLDLDPSLRVYVGGGPLRQVLSNLLGNAIAYNHPGGHVVVTADTSLDLAGAPRVRVTVSDDGPGLDAAQRAAVFTPFVRFADADRPGTGLGLALSRTLVERFGGQMGVEASSRGGCAFWFELPACDLTGNAGAGPVGTIPAVGSAR